MAATVTSRPSRATASFCAWRLPNLPIGRVCAISRSACAHSDRSSITWAFAVRCRGTHWPMRTSSATGRIYAEVAHALIRIARPMYASEDLGLDLDNTVFALGRIDHRSVSVHVSVGAIPIHEGGDQAAHAARFARPDSYVPACFRRQDGRCPRARPPRSRACGLLCDGSCLSRLRAPEYAGGIRRVLRHPRKVEHTVPPSVLSVGRQDDRSSL